MEYSIMNGDKKTGLSYMKMTEGLDEGPVYEMHECIIEPNDKLSDIEKKLIELSKKNLVPFLNRIKNRQAKSHATQKSWSIGACCIGRIYQCGKIYLDEYIE